MIFPTISAAGNFTCEPKLHVSRAALPRSVGNFSPAPASLLRRIWMIRRILMNRRHSFIKLVHSPFQLVSFFLLIVGMGFVNLS